MARIVYPTDFLKRTVLFQNMKAKHDADGAGSVLIPFLTQQGIDLGGDEVATNKAIKKNTLFEENDKNGEEYTEARNNLFNPVFGRLKKMVQFLKKLFAGNTKELGLWGVQVDGRRIVYPADFLRRAELYKAFKARHDAMGAASPLVQFLTQHDIDMAADGADVTKAEGKHDQMQQAKKDAEDYREERDNLFSPVFANVRSIGQYLKGLFVNNPKELGHWGYTVDDSPRPPKKVTRKIAPQSTRILKRLANGSVLTNTGKEALVLYRKEGTSTEGTTLTPGEDFEIRRGWGTVTVANIHLTAGGTIDAEITS